MTMPFYILSSGMCPVIYILYAVFNNGQIYLRFPLPRRGTPWIPSLFCKVRGYEGQEKIVIGDEALLILEANPK